MNTIKLKDKHNNLIQIERIDITYVARGVMIGSKETIFEFEVDDMIKNADQKYGDYRPIQIIRPKIEDEFDYGIFVDLKKYGRYTTNEIYEQVIGLLYFCSANDISIDNIKENVMQMCNWSLSKKINPEDY